MFYILAIIVSIILDVLFWIYRKKKHEADVLNALTGTNDYKWWDQKIFLSKKEREEIEHMFDDNDDDEE